MRSFIIPFYRLLRNIGPYSHVIEFFAATPLRRQGGEAEMASLQCGQGWQSDLRCRRRHGLFGGGQLVKGRGDWICEGLCGGGRGGYVQSAGWLRTAKMLVSVAGRMS